MRNISGLYPSILFLDGHPSVANELVALPRLEVSKHGVFEEPGGGGPFPCIIMPDMQMSQISEWPAKYMK